MNSLYRNKIRHFFVPKGRITIIAICSISFQTFAQVTANFSASPVAGCPPLQVTFTDISTGNPTSWNWNFGNGNSGTGQTAGAIYTIPGVYTVTLTVTNGASSDTEIKTAYITVYNKPTAGFTISTDTACIGQSVTFTDATVISPGGPPIGTWAWNFGDGFSTSATVPSVTHIYSTPGNYPVSVNVTDTNGCSGNTVKNIVVLPKPALSFTATPISACAPPLNVTFTNNSTSIGATTYLWNFGDGSTSTALNPVHTYTASGSYNVTLYVNQNGCIDSLIKPNTIIIQKIVAGFSATPTAICSGDSILFTNTSVPSAITADWDFGDGGTSTAINPTHTYIASGTFTVTLISGDASGCKDTITDTITVHQTPVANFIADTMAACSVPFTVNFTNTSTGATNWVWNFGDGSPVSILQNPSHTYNATGTFSVSLIAINASGPCIDTIVKNFFITIAPPVAGFLLPPDSGCVPLTINFLNASLSLVDPITNYTWNFGDGSSATAAPPLSHTYTATGIYSASLIVQTSKGCTDTVTCFNCIKVGIKPIADFGIIQDTVCYGKLVQFSDSSINATGWLWDFGDGQFSTLQNPPHMYPDTGTYQITLIAFNNGCPDTSLVKKVVILPPKAIFTYALSCTNYYTVQFTDASHGADSLVWKFGDGTYDLLNTQNPVHTYPSRGPITVMLTAYNYATGCADSITASFTIAEPIAGYSVTAASGCYPFIVNLQSTSQDAVLYHWNLGDPTSILDTSIVDSAAYTYNNPGAYPVTLIITDVNGCKDTLIDTLKTLGPLPYFYADTLTGCRPLLVTFTDTSISDSTLTQWIWNFGDGSPNDTTYNDSIAHTYTVTGSFNVTMTVRDTNGCVKTIVKSNYIRPTFPNPAFTVDTFACKSDILTYNASATTVIGGTYYWNYGDGNLDTTNNPIITHAYTNDGLYVVSLTVVDVNGCDNTITDTVRILKPAANFGWTIDTVYCGNMQVTFTDLSTGMLGPLPQWAWNFGVAGSAILQNPTVFYSTGGIFSVTLTVTNGGGCKDTLVLDSIITVPLATGNFTLTPAAGCNPLTVCFNASAINTSGYIWDFGDGTVISCVGGDTCHTYLNAGTFNPQLILEYIILPDSTLCTDTATNLTGPVIVSNVINVSLSGIPALPGPPYVTTVPIDSLLAITATYPGGTPPYTFNWSPDTGINCDTCANILIVGTGDTIFYVFTIYDAAGCIGMDSILVLSEPCFEEDLIPNVFSPNADGANDLFYIPGVCAGEKYSLQIYDRWGTLMFSTTLRNNAWDGRTNAGVAASDGVYYFIVYVDENIYKGAVHLVR
ncbi:MAG: PKD domain-containing protein [Bacteroidetes bacterium]|nr:MAG: PKD domain-containing protein [Bacteroidota bacterium]